MVSVARIGRAADAHRHRDLLAPEVDRLHEARQEVLDARRHAAGRLQVAEHDDELVAAQPGDDVAAPVPLIQALGRAQQEVVARVVAEEVVDPLKWSRSSRSTASSAPVSSARVIAARRRFTSRDRFGMSVSES